MAISKVSLGTKNRCEVIESSHHGQFSRPLVWESKQWNEGVRRLERSTSASDCSGVLARQLESYSFGFQKLQR
jgi:hypothetical protein